MLAVTFVVIALSLSGHSGAETAKDLGITLAAHVSAAATLGTADAVNRDAGLMRVAAR
jgi:hypothetical protein